jgi:hypothetical protein
MGYMSAVICCQETDDDATEGYAKAGDEEAVEVHAIWVVVAGL